MRHHLRSFTLLTVLAALAAGCRDSAAPEKPGPATDIAVSAGNAQTGSAGSPLLAPIAAKVTDARGRGVPHAAVFFQPVPGSGSVTPGEARTNGSGIATTAWTLPNVAGTNARLRAVLIDTTTGALVDSTSFTATVVGGAPSQIYPAGAPALAAAGSAVPLEVMLVDQFGNRSPNAPVAWTVMGGGGSVAPASGASDANGYQTVGAYGAVIPLGVTVYDGLGARVAGATVAWTVTSGSGTVAPATSTTNASGVASAQLTLGTSSGITTVAAKVGTLATTFSVEIREFAPRAPFAVR